MSMKKRRKKNWGDLLTKDLPSLEAVFFADFACCHAGGFIFRSAELSSGVLALCSAVLTQGHEMHFIHSVD